ncbi:hypothetical protein [Natronomonas sp.]
MIVVCTSCEETDPAQGSKADRSRPIGTDGTCSCGNDEFEVVGGEA